MINKEKIEKAAIEHSAEHWLSDDCRTAFEDGFCEGIKWYEDNLNKEKSSTTQTELKPFQKVLVRNKNIMYWHINFFEGYTQTLPHKYICLDDVYEQCIPYEGNEALLGTSNNPLN